MKFPFIQSYVQIERNFNNIEEVSYDKGKFILIKQ